MIDNETKFLINELRSYNYLFYKLMDMTEHHSKSLKNIEDHIKRIDAQLNEYHIPAISYDRVSISSIKASASSRVIELMSEQEQLYKRLKEIQSIQKDEVYKLASRIDDVDKYLNKLTRWEREFVTHMYIESKCIEYMMETYNYSRKSIYNKSNYILAKMLSFKKNETLHTV